MTFPGDVVCAITVETDFILESPAHFWFSDLVARRCRMRIAAFGACPRLLAIFVFAATHSSAFETSIGRWHAASSIACWNEAVQRPF